MSRLRNFLSIASLLLAAAVHAADPAAEARDLFVKGQQAMAAGKHADAVTSYQASYRVSKAPTVLFFIAEAQRAAGQDAKALASYEEYLAKLPNAPKKAEAEVQVVALKAKLGANPKMAIPEIDLDEEVKAAPAKKEAKVKKVAAADPLAADAGKKPAEAKAAAAPAGKKLTKLEQKMADTEKAAATEAVSGKATAEKAAADKAVADKAAVEKAVADKAAAEKAAVVKVAADKAAADKVAADKAAAEKAALAKTMDVKPLMPTPMAPKPAMPPPAAPVAAPPPAAPAAMAPAQPASYEYVDSPWQFSLTAGLAVGYLSHKAYPETTVNNSDWDVLPVESLGAAIEYRLGQVTAGLFGDVAFAGKPAIFGNELLPTISIGPRLGYEFGKIRIGVFGSRVLIPQQPTLTLDFSVGADVGFQIGHWGVRLGTSYFTGTSSYPVPLGAPFTSHKISFWPITLGLHWVL